MLHPARASVVLALSLLAGSVLGGMGGTKILIATAIAILLIRGIWGIRKTRNETHDSGTGARALCFLGRSGWPLAVLLIAGWRAADERVELPRTPASLHALRAVEQRVVRGTWRPLSGRASSHLGTLDPPSGMAPHLGHRLLYECRGFTVARGEPLLVLPGDAPLPFATGPVPGPRARDGRIVGVCPLLPDTCRRLAPHEVRAAGSIPDTARSQGSGARSSTSSSEPQPGWRNALRTRLDTAPLNPRQHDLLQGLLFGDARAVDGETEDLFRRTGTRHLLAVSGMHVGLVAGLLLVPLAWTLTRLVPRRAVRIRAIASAGLLALGLLFYIQLVGGRPPVVRAGLALSLALLAPLLGTPERSAGVRKPGAREARRASGLGLWAIAYSLELVVHPGSWNGLGVTLSYAATLGILLALAGAGRGSPPPGWSELSPYRVQLVRVPLRRCLRMARTTLVVSAGAFLATLPFIWTSFGEVAPWGLFVTPLAVAPLAGAIVGGLLGIFDIEAGWSVARVALDALLALLETADELPATPWPVPERPTALVVAVAWGALACLTARRTAAHLERSARRVVALLAAALLLPWCPSAAVLEVHALDVGHGSCFVVRAPGLPALVYDAGSRDRGRVYEEALAPLLARWDPGEIIIGFSHAHTDHGSGLRQLATRRRPVLWLGAPPPEGIEAALPAQLDPQLGCVTWQGAETGPRLTLVRGSEMPGNESSRLLEIEWQGRRVFLTGDAEQEGLARALDESWLSGPADLLILPHHGSDTPWLGPLLEAVRPRTVWISGTSPAPVAAELERRRAKTLVTGRDGSLRLLLGPASQRNVRSRREDEISGNQGGAPTYRQQDVRPLIASITPAVLIRTPPARASPRPQDARPPAPLRPRSLGAEPGRIPWTKMWTGWQPERWLPERAVRTSPATLRPASRKWRGLARPSSFDGWDPLASPPRP